MKPQQLLGLIPTKVRIKRDVAYEVVFIESFDDPKQIGECRYDKKQIVLKKGESPTETFKTFLHECIHAINFECEGLGITEKQTGKLEDEIFRVLKLNNVLDVLVKNR